MIRTNYELMPNDVLFFRDGRPMDVDKKQQDVRNVGHGANWPRPDHLFKGVIHALIGDRMASLDAICAIDEAKEPAYGNFGGLRVFGPFPVKEGEIYLPRPLDWDMRPFACKAETDLPAPLEYGFIDRCEGKKKYPAWVKLSDYKEYLEGRDHDLHVEKEKDDDGNEVEVVKFPYSDSDLFSTEHRIGNTLDARTNASKRIQDEHRSGEYQADYLRLENGVSMWCSVKTGLMKGGAEAPEMPETFIMGGQGGLVRRKKTEIDFGAAMIPPPKGSFKGKLVKWTLLAPAYFSGNGWRPDFCRYTSTENRSLGEVMLHDEANNRIGAELVGACVGKPVAYSGWDAQTHVKPTQLAVPAGSVYLFRCDNDEAAKRLIDKLHFMSRSQNSGQGFGIGVCSLVNDPAVQSTEMKKEI